MHKSARSHAVAVSVFNSGQQQQQDKADGESPSAAATLERGHGQQAAEGLGGRGVVGALAGSRSPLHAVVATGAPRRRLQKVGAPCVGKARARGRNVLRRRDTRHAGTRAGFRVSIGVQGSDQDGGLSCHEFRVEDGETSSPRSRQMCEDTVAPSLRLHVTTRFSTPLPHAVEHGSHSPAEKSKPHRFVPVTKRISSGRGPASA